MGAIFAQQPPGTIPYKLFEIVEGARLQLVGHPGEEVVAEVTIRTPQDRSFVYRARAEVGSDGVARMRLPYATDGATPAAAITPYRVRVGEREVSLEIPEDAVVGGRILRRDTRSG